MKTIKKAIAYILIAAALLPCFSLMAAAKNVCNEVSGQTDEDGGVNTVFYVTASDTDEHYVKMKMTKGRLNGEENLIAVWCFGQEYIYDYYEIIVYGREKNGIYKQISKTNVKDESSYKIWLEGYKDYKIKIYSWKAQTINDVAKYIKHPVVRSKVQSVHWDKIPTWKISRTSGVSLCR